MSDIEKATRAIKIVYGRLSKDHRSDAEKIVQMAYQCERAEAEEFVQVLEDIYGTGD